MRNNNSSDSFVISGIAGRFASCQNVDELRKKLYSHTEGDTVNDQKVKWWSSDPDSVHSVLLELAYEATFDAGIHPKSLRESRTNVYIDDTWIDEETSNVNVVDSKSATTSVDFIVKHLHLKDSGMTNKDSNSLSALSRAYEDLRSDKCDVALVGACNLNSDAAKNESKAAVVILLQRKSIAKRIYANIVHVETSNDSNYSLVPFYNDIAVDSNSVAYVVSDENDWDVLSEVFCAKRNKHLTIGPIKLNFGDVGHASGLCGLTQALLALGLGFIPPNRCSEELYAKVEERVKICTEMAPLSGPLCAVHSSDAAGRSTHCLLRQWAKVKVNSGAPSDTLPRLVTWNGRGNDSIASMFDQLTTMPMDAEFIGLLHEIQQTADIDDAFRGFGIFDSRGVTAHAICLANEQIKSSDEQRPIVWLFSGMGSQWQGMGESLRQIDIACDVIDKCHEILLPFGIDVWAIISSNDPAIFDNILNSLVGISVIQIALVDILRAVDLPADYFIGHSAGELICSYADGSLTLAETILCSYWRGKTLFDEPMIDGCMAAVGLSYANIKNQLPDGIYVACHNSTTSCTLSGPKEDIERFVAELQSKGIFAKAVNSSGVAFHSKYVHSVYPKSLAKYEQTIVKPRPRSTKTLSTSVPVEDWHLPIAKCSSGEYIANNLVNPVYFEEALSKVPSNAIIIEIGPYGLLQAIMKRELPNAVHIPLMQKFTENNSLNILTALGRIFLHGTPLRVKHLYPPVQFPVSRGTCMIAPLIKWDNSANQSSDDAMNIADSRERNIVVDFSGKKFEFLKGHVIDDRVVLPATGYLHLVREALVRMTPGATLDTTNILFENLKFLRATTLVEDTPVQLRINIHRDSGNFEITENSSAVVSGTVKATRSPESVTSLDDPSATSMPHLKSNDFYKELRLRGFFYDGAFRVVQSARADGRESIFEWKNDNWVAFMDAMLQVIILSKDSRSLQLPTEIREVKINAVDHFKYLQNLRSGDDGKALCKVRMSPELNTIACGGIEITGLTLSTISRRPQKGDKVLDRYEFVPLNGDVRKYSVNDAVRICAQLIQEKLQLQHFQVIEVLGTEAEPLIEHFQTSLHKMPSVDGQLILMAQRPFPELVDIDVQLNSQLSETGDSTVVIAQNCFSDCQFVSAAARSLVENGFLISVEPGTTTLSDLRAPNGFQLLSLVRCEEFSLILMQRDPIKDTSKSVSVKIDLRSDDSSYRWLKSLQQALAAPSKPSITFVVQNDSAFGALGLINSIRREKGDYEIQLVQIEDKFAPAFDSNHALYAEQLKFRLPINIYRNGAWGTYRHSQIPSNTVEKCVQNETLRVSMRKIGDLSSMVWRPESNPESFIDIHYSALNFRDVMLASGRLAVDALPLTRREREKYLGLEFSGVTSADERVMGMCGGGAMATRIDANDAFLTWPVPDDMSLREAATIPVVYTTVYYALFVKNEVRAGESILIHAGTGGVGLAAIRVAFAYNLRVFTTVSTAEKRNYLLREFPNLKENHIGNSRDVSFEQMILRETDGQGVDYVLNSLSEKKLIASVRCLRRGGAFLEIGKFDIFNNSNLGMRLFEKGISFRTIFADQLNEMPNDRKIIHERIGIDLKRGIIQPLPTTVFAGGDVEKAVRYLSGAKHIGKVLLQIRRTEEHSLTLPLKILPKVVCDPDAVFVLIDGPNRFGLELADWLVVRGAQHLVLNFKSDQDSSYQTYRIGLWRSYGCNVHISNDDPTTHSGCKQLLQTAGEHGPVRAIFNLTDVIRDKSIEHQTPASFDECLIPKLSATKCLDELSRQMCPKLKHFVIFSSATSALGNVNQTSYGMANAAIERIIERRKNDKLPAKAIQWGDVERVLGEDSGMPILGTLPQRLDSCLSVMDDLMCDDGALVTAIVLSQKDQEKKLDLIGSVFSILGIADIKSVSSEASLGELGVDSLMTNEIKQLLEREYDMPMTSDDIRLLTVSELTQLSDKQQNEANDTTSPVPATR